MNETIEFFPLRVERTDWHSSHPALTAVRHQVFVVEQGVPPEAEIDGEDTAALHWIVFSEEAVQIGTARLVGNRVGRMAVLAGHRRKGVGASLLRAIIHHAGKAGMETLVLDAQRHALPFYEKFGFVTSGTEFDDVGIPHLPMRLELRHFGSPRPSPSPSVVDDALRRRVELDTPSAFASAALNLVDAAERQVRLFSQRLDPRLYDNDELCAAVLRVATRHPNAEVQILIGDTSELLRHNHRLVELFIRLSSRTEIRVLNPERTTPHAELLISDEQGVLYNQREDGYQGYCYHHAPLEARHLGQDFDSLWNSSVADPALRRLYL